VTSPDIICQRTYIPYLLECNAHLFWPNYVAKIRVRIRFYGALDSMANLKNTTDHAAARPRVFFCLFSR
jgi:hypothetical protein